MNQPTASNNIINLNNELNELPNPGISPNNAGFNPNGLYNMGMNNNFVNMIPTNPNKDARKSGIFPLNNGEDAQSNSLHNRYNYNNNHSNNGLLNARERSLSAGNLCNLNMSNSNGNNNNNNNADSFLNQMPPPTLIPPLLQAPSNGSMQPNNMNSNNLNMHQPNLQRFTRMYVLMFLSNRP